MYPETLISQGIPGFFFPWERRSDRQEVQPVYQVKDARLHARKIFTHAHAILCARIKVTGAKRSRPPLMLGIPRR